MEKVSFLVELKEKIFSQLKKIREGFKNISNDVNETQKKIDGLTSTTSRFKSVCSELEMPNINAWLQVVDRVKEGFNQTADAGMAFEQSIADLQSITGIAGKDLESLRDNCRRLGVESGLGAAEAARSYSLLASQIEISKIGMDGLNSLQERAITLAQASGMSMEASANALAGTINQFGLSAEEADRVINVLAAGSKYGAAEIEDLSQSFKVVGAAASAMGLTVESTAGALEILSQANLKGSEAGTALRNIILKLNTELGIDLGETSLSKALEDLQPKLSDATYLSKVFGMENIAAAQFLIQNAEAVDEMTAQLTDTNVAQEQATIRTETNAHTLAQMRAQVDNLKIGITELTGGLTPYLVLLSDNINFITLLGKGIVKLVSLKKALATAQLMLSKAMMAIPWVLIASAVVAVGVAIYDLATAESAAEKAQRKVNEAFSEFKSNVDAEISGVDTLFKMLKSAKEGTDAYRVVKQKIIDKYGTYLEGLNEEIRTLKDVEGAYLAICTAAKQAAKERAITDLNTKAQNTYGEDRKTAISNLETHLKSTIKDTNIVDTLMELVVRDFDATGKISDVTRDLIFKNIPNASYNGRQMASYATPRSNAEYHMGVFEKSMRNAQQALDTTHKETERMFGLSMNEFSGFTEKQAKAVLASAEKLLGSGKATGNWKISGTKVGIKDIIGTNEAELQLVINKLKEVVELKKKMGGASSTSTVGTQDKAYWEKIRDQKKQAYDLLDVSKLNTEEANTLKKEWKEAQAKVDAFDLKPNKTQGKTADTRANKSVSASDAYNEAYNEALKNMQSQIADLGADAIEDATDREVEQINRDAQRKIDALDESIDELVKKRKEQDKALWLSQDTNRVEADWKPTKSDAEYRNDVLNENDYALLTKYYDLLDKINAEESRRLKEYEAPDKVEELETLEELEKALTYYQQKLQQANVSEGTGIAKTIEVLKQKRDALASLWDLPGMESQIAELGKLSGKQLKIELELIGLDGIKGKIRELQKMLVDTENPKCIKSKE